MKALSILTAVLFLSGVASATGAAAPAAPAAPAASAPSNEATMNQGSGSETKAESATVEKKGHAKKKKKNKEETH